MPKPLIDGVRTKKLNVMSDERGRLMEMVRTDDEIFVGAKQVYMTTAYPGVTKAWHYHRLQTDNFVCVRGMMKVVLYDARETSPTNGMVNEFFVGEHNPLLVQIPPMVYHGFKCISDHEAIIINTVTELYNYTQPDEFRVDPHSKEIPYDWSRKDG